MNEDVARKWLKQARHDLELAEKIIEIKGYDIASFLAHQAVEKLLKSLLIAAGREVPRTHFIDELAHRLGVAEEVEFHINGLTAEYTLARYPDVSDKVPYEQYSEAIAREKVRAAKKVFEMLRDRYAGILEEQ